MPFVVALSCFFSRQGLCLSLELIRPVTFRDLVISASVSHFPKGIVELQDVHHCTTCILWVLGVELGVHTFMAGTVPAETSGLL